MSYQKMIIGDTKEEVIIKANEEIKRLGIMRQPFLESVSYRVAANDGESGKWVATIKYWGLD